MLKKTLFLLTSFIFLSPLTLFSQENINVDNNSPEEFKINDTIQNNKPFILDKIEYNAQDSVKIDQKLSRIYLYNKANIKYQDMELKAGYIVLDYEKSEVYAGRIRDSIGNYSQKPFFRQANNEVNPDSIRFNFDTKRAIIWNSKSSQSGMNVFSGFTKKENDSVYFLKNAKMTTSQNEKNPDYYIRISKGKMVPGKKIVAGFTNLYIADIPTPVALPFAYFPTTQNRQSGFIFPTIGESNERGYYLQSLGYYLPLSKYFR